MKRTPRFPALRIVLVVASLCTLAVIFPRTASGADDDNAKCVACHANATPGILEQWKASKHFGAEVGCYDCHRAEEADADGVAHHGYKVAVIVSPKDCSQCHEKEYREQMGSHHAKAGQILGSLDNLLGEVIGGEAAVDAGCRQCHGSLVVLDKKGKPRLDTWPNTGMGRINPDGSSGSCSACHLRHQFSKAQARQPEACGKCHLGPDHPQMEVWEESKHGVAYRAQRESMKLDADPWRAGKEYFSGPTCASCHMSAAGKLPVTHDVGERISWTLRPPISVKLNMVVFEDGSKDDITGDAPALPEVGSMLGGKKVVQVVPWSKRRDTMKLVCLQCHSEDYVAGAYAQFDGVVSLYNTKFAEPAKAIIGELKAQGLISQPDFDDPIEWTWWELWHHEGRRARHGAAMQGPDYTWWHGIYDVAKNFYTHFIPEVKQVAGEPLATQLLEKYVYTHCCARFPGAGRRQPACAPAARRVLQQLSAFAPILGNTTLSSWRTPQFGLGLPSPCKTKADVQRV